MAESKARSSPILRAELRYGELADVACAVDLSEDSVFVVSDVLPPVGARVDLTLSFPRAVRAVNVTAEVREVRLDQGPGIASGFRASFEASAPAERERVCDLVRRMRDTTREIGRKELRVLLVEDNRLVRDMFHYALDKHFAGRECRVRLDHASDVPSAWLRLHTRHYDLLVVDYHLPDEDGATLIARLRKEPTLASTAVVAISVANPEVRRATIAAGADLFLKKPLVFRDLFHTLEFVTLDGAADVAAS